jgi:hypothetical protein
MLVSREVDSETMQSTSRGGLDSGRQWCRLLRIDAAAGVVAWTVFLCAERPSAFMAWLAFGIAVIAPLAVSLCGRDARAPVLLRILAHAALPAAGAALVACALPQGTLAGCAALPWLAWTFLGAVVGRSLVWTKTVSKLSAGAALWSLGMGGAFFTSASFGARPLGFSPYLMLLTAIHFHFATLVSLTLLASVARHTPTEILSTERRRALAAGFILGPVGIAVGVSTWRPAAWMGTLVFGMALLAFAAWLGTRYASRQPLRSTRVLTRSSALAVAVTIPLAIAWSTQKSFGHDAIAWETMVWVHGALNAVGFSLCGLVAQACHREPAAPPVDPLQPPRSPT